jgi:hypothetical protein
MPFSIFAKMRKSCKNGPIFAKFCEISFRENFRFREAGASDSLGACFGCVGDIDTIYIAVALSVWTWQAIQESIQNKLRAVLPTSGMCVLPDQLKKSATDKKIRPHTLEAVFVDVYKDS